MATLAELGEAVTSAQEAHDAQFKVLKLSKAPVDRGPDFDIDAFPLEHVEAMQDPTYASLYLALEAAKAANYEAQVADAEEQKPVIRAQQAAARVALALQEAEEAGESDEVLIPLRDKVSRLNTLVTTRAATLVAKQAAKLVSP